MRAAPIDLFTGWALFKFCTVVVDVFGDMVLDIFPGCRGKRDIAFDTPRHDGVGHDVRGDNRPDLHELFHDPVGPDVHGSFITGRFKPFCKEIGLRHGMLPCVRRGGTVCAGRIEPEHPKVP